MAHTLEPRLTRSSAMAGAPRSGTRAADLWGAGLFLACYVLDDTDGEVARAKRACSPGCASLDTVVDAVVHTVFFAALGIDVGRATGELMWTWMGWAATFGSFVNADVPLPREAGEIFGGDVSRVDDDVAHGATGTFETHPFSAIRALSRADFRFVVTVLALYDLTWRLLPAAAVGAQSCQVGGLSCMPTVYHV